MKKVYLTIVLACSIFIGNAQDANSVTAGLGIGLDYGGIGAQVAYQIDNEWGAFVGLGTAIASTGYNVGVSYLLSGNSTEQFFLEALYGYNAVILVDDPIGGDVRQTYYGPSIGGGLNLQNKGGNSFWHFALLIPVRNSDYRRDWDAIKNDPNIETTFSLPFTITIGINFKL